MDFLKWLVVFILTWEARLTLARYKPRVIAITGSVGKTSTKDAIYAALSREIHMRKSEKSFNSEIGLPLTILGCENAWRNPLKWMWNIVKGLWIIIIPQDYPKWLVLEVGADRPGDIRRIARWLSPDVVVFTGVSEIPVHVEFFESPEALAREKRILAEHLAPGGKLVLNGDDARLQEVRAAFRGASVTYGIEKNNDFCALHDEILYEGGVPVGVHFRVNRAEASVQVSRTGGAGSSLPVSIFGALGRPRVYAGLAALAVAEIVGVDLVSAARALGEWAPPPGRLRLIPGVKGSLIIDDTYNSSPAAALAALDTLKDVAGTRRRIAVLGDMLELGKYSAEAHRAVGVRAAVAADMLITVGFRARAAAESALDAGMPEGNIRQYEHNESQRAGKELELQLEAGDLVLVKGSQSMRMERTVLEIMANPERAAELLVRQDPEWLTKT